MALAQEAPGIGREDAARAAFEHAASFHDADDLTIRAPATSSLETYVEALGESIEDAARRAGVASERYQRVIELHVPHWTLAAFVEQARIYERLARALRDSLEELRVAGVARAAAAFEPRLRGIECIAVERYVIAARAARAGRLETDATRYALAALRAYDERHVRACVDAARERDPSFARLSAGELGHASALPRNATSR
ncbi:hypothetical protein [Sandaracinus amylolyticus]|uniref:Uncharacterized protein n=1 Tax=Sandaracinus amylolyticus TaxID=927083 RepID=A0A0F6W6X4_9BACT|nr:hypothetical protein [Sandaracinus amylolyticus]AKF08973.1 hypothetical protein DB32_006122 [Sandaracinus amylolyticus]